MLTYKEFDILHLLAKHPGRVFSKEQIYDLVWNELYSGDYNIVMTHIHHIRMKIEGNQDSPFHFIQLEEGSPEELIRSLFWLEEEKPGFVQVFPIQVKDEVLSIEKFEEYKESGNDCAGISLGIIIRSIKLAVAVWEWISKKEAVRTGVITEEEYQE